MSRPSLGPLLYLVRLTFRRQFLSRKTVLVLAFLILLAVLVALVGVLRPWTTGDLGRWVLLEIFQGFFVPLVALAYGTGALGDDRDEKSLIHLLARPLPRTGIYLGKLLAATLISAPLSLGGLLLLCGLGGLTLPGDSLELFRCLWIAVALSSIGYLCLFQLFAAAFRHSTVIAVAYVFFIETFIGRMPGILKRISIKFYAHCIAYEEGGSLGIALHRRELRFYLPIDGETALWVLAALAVILFAAGAAVFARKEYRDLA